MIAKFSTGNNLYGTLTYNMQKIEDKEASVLAVNEVWENPNGVYSMRDFVQSFNLRLDKNQRTEKPIVHISLNPDPKDELTNEQFQEIAEKYMKGMGFGEQPYIVFKHEDIERKHIHIVTTNVDKNGKKINDSNNFFRSKELTNDIEKEYKLHSADIKKDNRIWTPAKVERDKGRISYQIRNIAKHLISNYSFQSINEYKALLGLYNVELTEVKGETKEGQAYKGITYIATDDFGERLANPIKSSTLGKAVGYKALDSKIEKSTLNIKNLDRNKIKRILSNCIQKSTSPQELQNHLNESGLNIIFRENETGRIYGATIVDHNSKIVLNGSKLGKEFAANAWQILFERWRSASNSGNLQAESLSAKPINEQPEQISKETSEKTYIPVESEQIESNSKEIDESLISIANMLDALFTPATTNTTTSGGKKKKRKKKKKRHHF
ncbi:MAG: conjugal transfer protein MobB [Bacteroidales bacterium]